MLERTPNGIRRRIALTVAAVSAVGLLGIAMITIAVVRTSAEAGLREISRSAVAGAVEVGQPISMSNLNMAAVDASGQLPPTSTVVPEAAGPAGDPVLIVADDAMAAQATSILVPGPSGPVTVTALTASGGLDGAVKTLTLLFLLGGPLLVLALTVASYRLTGRALRPVTRIIARAQAITASNLDQRVPVPAADDEIARLAVTVNEMLDRVQVGVRRQQQFVSDASHELRSPLTALLGEVDIALAHPDKGSWPDAARRVRAQGDRLESLVANLLLAAAQNEAPTAPRVPVNVTDLVLEEVSLATVPVDTSEVGLATVEGDEVGLSSAIRNLLANAGRHARVAVAVAVAVEGDHVLVTVDDDGPGVPPEFRDEIFQRFRRLDEARNGDDGGVGLGLAIVDAVARGHAGSCRVTDSPLGGARFVLALPVSCTAAHC